MRPAALVIFLVVRDSLDPVSRSEIVLDFIMTFNLKSREVVDLNFLLLILVDFKAGLVLIE